LNPPSRSRRQNVSGDGDCQPEQERTANNTLQALQRQFVRQERLAAVGLLAAGVAHELNNPPQAILGSAELLERQEGLSSDVRAEIDFIKAQSTRAREIIRSLARFSSSHPGPPSAVRLRDVAAEVLALRGGELESPELTVEVEDTSSHLVYANFAELEQITMNFLLNAQQAVESHRGRRERARIQIRIVDSGCRVRLEVNDNGPGVAPEDEPKLFQPFFTTRPVGGGTGLGLSVSYGIVQAYGGTIGYLRNVWGGATFFFELPAFGPKTHPAETPGEMTRDAEAVLRRPVQS
jgi:two-component system NtrC family sensor kinase